jgi:hypothetical protein
MQRRRPGGITALAILNIVFGGLFSLCSLNVFAEKTITVNNRDVTQAFKEFMDREVPGYSTYLIVFAVTELALAFGFIFSGIGMLRLAQWGRVLGLVCAGLAILHQLGNGLYQLLAINPAIAKFFTQFGQLMGGLGGSFVQIAGVVTMVVALIAVGYNVLLIIVLLSNSSARAFSKDGRGADDLDEEEGEEWDERQPYRGRSAREEEEEDDYPDDRRRPMRRPREDEEPPPRRPPARPQPREVDEDDDDEEGRYRSPRRGR